MNNWVTAAEFSTAPEAHIAAGMLEDNGIPVMVGPDRMATIYGGGSTWAPVTLSVSEADLERAQQLLAARGDS